MSERTARLDISGMSCANCAQTIGESLRDIDGIPGAEINYATDTGTVTYDPDRASMGDIFAAVRDAGYEPVSETVSIGITDMTCANCAETNEGALDRTPGVVSVDVNYATDEAQVTYNPADTNRDALYDAIEGAGYSPVRESADGSEGDSREAAREAETDRQRRLTLFGAIL
jgi:Cu+-exporting ATPase